MKTILVVLASALLLLGGLGIVFAQSDTANVQVTVSVPGMVSISADPLGFGDIQTSEYGTTYLTFEVDSNNAYVVYTRADEESFTGGDTPFAVNQMVFGTSNTPYTTSNQQIATGSAGTTPHSVQHTLTIPGGTQAGNYGVGITLTVTA